MPKLEKAARFAADYADKVHHYTHELMEEFEYNSKAKQIELMKERFAKGGIMVPDGQSPGLFYSLGSYTIANGELIFTFDGKLPHQAAKNGDRETYKIGDMLREIEKNSKGVIEAGLLPNPIDHMDSLLNAVTFVSISPHSLSAIPAIRGREMGVLVIGNLEVRNLGYNMNFVFEDVGLTLKEEKKEKRVRVTIQ